ncbi:N-acetylmuramoyl-L-alanine amidase [Streptomyces zagrosensis]|uniref:N-acetylmuramoyl-L-alanine amidase n=1 Tax=Streptomyces zagrosensis TaxID=1042984 RepID=A0A7W9Q486_9ACTN|nr:N-acetylmuramoyl-L-alanine amidase [Streptomyces zagrosensis]MBB5933250.1 N-acetylmuramoyl-L-alanine amidase [Streptomyces zagrosensis]
MSNGSFPPTPRRLGGTLVIVLAVLAPVCFAGWLVWRSMSEDDAKAAGAPSGASSAPSLVPNGGGKQGVSGSPGASAQPQSPAPSRAPAKNALRGKVVVVDPGHNPRNRDHTADIARTVDVGTHRKECDTTGTATNSGYAEATFTLDVSRRVRTLLSERGATVKLTQNDDRPYGPCVDERAAIGNEAHADAAVSVHADGAGAGQRGFHVILPASVRGGGADTSAITGPSRRLGNRLVRGFTEATQSAPANYLGGGEGLTVRDDLGGLNLSTVPKVFIECGNMRDSKDAALLTDAHWRQRAARGIADGITDFLLGKR